MFSTQKWYIYKVACSNRVMDAIREFMITTRVSDDVYRYILSFIRCPKCGVLYDNDDDCLCWMFTPPIMTIQDIETGLIYSITLSPLLDDCPEISIQGL